MAEFFKTVIDDQFTVVTERHEHSRSVHCGLWVPIGTRDEPSGYEGACHFIEHLVFKGTTKRSAFEIVRDMERWGAEINAYTTREHTCFYTSSLSDDLFNSLEVLLDILYNANFPNDEFEREKNVVLQEIAMGKEDPEEYVFDEFFLKAFSGTGMGIPILGTKKSLSKINRKMIFDFYKDQFRNGKILLSIAGQVNHQKVVDWIVKRLPKRKKSKMITRRRRKPTFKYFYHLDNKEFEQTHILVGIPTVSYTSPYRFEAFVVNALLGGGMSSKLYQAVREKRGLAYSVYSQLNLFTDIGTVKIYAGTSKDKVIQILELIRKELEKIKIKGVTKSDLKLFRSQVRASLILGSEDMENRMNSLGANELTFGKYKPVEDVLEEVNRVSYESVNDFVSDFYKNDFGIFISGPVEEKMKKILEGVMS